MSDEEFTELVQEIRDGLLECRVSLLAIQQMI